MAVVVAVAVMEVAARAEEKMRVAGLAAAAELAVARWAVAMEEAAMAEEVRRVAGLAAAAGWAAAAVPEMAAAAAAVTAAQDRQSGRRTSSC